MKSRRALSTVVGAVFAIIALTSTVTYVSYSMGILDNYNQSVLTKNQQLSDVNKEKFQISSVTVPNSKLNITVVNTGSIPINFTKIWIQNTTTAAAKDWVKSYVPTQTFVIPGGVLTNIGQSVNIIPANSYNVKLVTSRGNTQQFMVNSPSVNPLNIQLYSIPSGVASGSNSELMMIVTNNGSSILTNISPSSLPVPTGSATCTTSSVSPTSYSTLLPGSTAIFKWDVTISGLKGSSCTYTLSKPLQNGYSQTIQSTIIVNSVSVSQASYASATGTLSLNYTSFRWAQSGSTNWNLGWSFTGANPTMFSVQVTNNNSTGDFYVSQYTQLAFHKVQSGGGGSNDVPFFLVNATNKLPSFGVTAFSCSNPNDYCIKIPAGQTVMLNFSASSAQGGDINRLGSGGSWFNMLLLFGKYANSRSGSGTLYGQDIPFLAVQST